MLLGRRGLLLGLTALAAGAHRVAFAAAPGEARFVVVILRGGLDGLAAVQPYADPLLAELRAPLALPEPGAEGALLDLGGRFGLHPALATLGAWYAAGEAAIVHAVAGPHRTRSHFDAQDALESGAERRLEDGWLNRAVAALWPAETGPADGPSRRAVALSQGLPLLLRGPARAASVTPPRPVPVSAETMERLAALYARDPLLGPAVAEGRMARRFAAEVLTEADPEHGPATNRAADREAFAALARAAGRLLADRQGPRVAALELGGFDTHAFQAARLRAALATLDSGLAALRQGLGSAWRQTAVLVVSEFGRTVRVNGSNGTDHGTAGVAFVAGGAIRGGRVLADWPGLSHDSLLEGRDLRPTTDLRAVAKALLAGHLGLPAAVLDSAVFPNSGAVRPLAGLV
ncbi:MAG: DUF1501 domain-containing protein [Acetobacteraceae bacterium]|nr:DUF1501 domain-containing protein [Acetobacteraceae bacterium]